MTKIKFGSQDGDAISEHQIISDGGQSDIQFGDLHERSRTSTRIFDLKSPADLALLSNELSALVKHVEVTPEAKAHPSDMAALRQAAAYAEEGNDSAAKKTLLNVGKWILRTASSIATPVAIEFLKSYIQS